MHTEKERYECTGVIWEHFANQIDVYRPDGSIESSNLWATVDGTRQIIKPKVINSNAQLNIIHSPWGFWTALINSFKTGAFIVYETTTNTRKNLRSLQIGYAYMSISNADGEDWGYIDLVEDKIYVGLPAENNNRHAFNGQCKRIY